MITRLKPDVFTDYRGSIKSFYPDEEIVEFSILETSIGQHRGFHSHPHFTEYMMVVNGKCEVVEYTNHAVTQIFQMEKGEGIRIPTGVFHSFTAIENLAFVSLLTARWNDSHPPIIQLLEDTT